MAEDLIETFSWFSHALVSFSIGESVMSVVFLVLCGHPSVMFGGLQHAAPATFAAKHPFCPRRAHALHADLEDDLLLLWPCHHDNTTGLTWKDFPAHLKSA